VQAQLQGGVSQVFANDRAFVALKGDGSLVIWGECYYEGNRSAVAQLQGGVISVFVNNQAFAALKDDGSLVTWGDAVYGGDSSAVQAQLQGGVNYHLRYLFHRLTERCLFV
jgi:hypothetical protein